MGLGIGIGLSAVLGRRAGSSGCETPPAGFAWLTLRGSFLTLNGKRLLVRIL